MRRPPRGRRILGAGASLLFWKIGFLRHANWSGIADSNSLDRLGSGGAHLSLDSGFRGALGPGLNDPGEESLEASPIFMETFALWIAVFLA